MQLDLTRALEDDPTIFDYDAVYDDMKKEKQTEVEKVVTHKPKYIGNLLKHAELRNREQERRTERKIQKEREAEGDEFKDKEAFVTSAYKEKLKQMKEDEEKEKREQAIEGVSSSDLAM